MVKRQCSIGLSTDVIEFIERNKGGFSFSAYTEYLLRESMKRMQRRGLRVEDEAYAEPRRAVIRAR